LSICGDDGDRRLARRSMARIETLQRLPLAAEYRDDGTHRHTERVARAAPSIARQLGLLLIWRLVVGGALSSDHRCVVCVAGALAGRHERKVQCVDCGVRLIFEGWHLKTRYSSRLAV
jgi:hypothetical protein